MINYDIRVDVGELLKARDRVAPDVVARAQARALNDTIGKVRTRAAREIKKRRNLKISVIKRSLVTVRASRRRMLASVGASYRPIPLKEYQARQTRAGVTVNITGHRKLWIPREGTPAFIVAKFSDNVFARTGRKRLPIKKQFGPDLSSAFASPAVFAVLDRVAHESFIPSFEHNLEFYSKST